MNFQIIAATILAASLSLSSCSLVKSITGAETVGNNSSSVETPKVDYNNKKKKKGDKKDSKNEIAESNSKTNYNKPSMEELSGGQWTIASVGSTEITIDEDVPYVNFDPEGRFYAYDGCNVINGDYALRSDGTLAFAHVLTTMKYCPDVEYGALITMQFNEEKFPFVDCKNIGQDTYLYFKDENGKTLMTLRRHNMEFLNGNWRITSVEGKKVNDEEANIFIDIAELKVHGNTGCNFFNGDLYINPQLSNAIDFSNMAITRMACPKENQERMILVALEESKTAKAGKHKNTGVLYNRDNEEVMILKRIEQDND